MQTLGQDMKICKTYNLVFVKKSPQSWKIDCTTKIGSFQRVVKSN